MDYREAIAAKENGQPVEAIIGAKRYQGVLTGEARGRFLFRGKAGTEVIDGVVQPENISLAIPEGE